MTEHSPRIQRTMRAMLAADAVRLEGITNEEAAQRHDVGPSTVLRATAVWRRSQDIASEVRRGKISLAEGERRAGMVGVRSFSGARLTHGDKWAPVMEAARVYVRHWANRDYVHINVREANRRLQVVREMIEGLHKIEEDLVTRSHKATTRRYY